MRAVRVGCSGWNYDSWRGRLYPEGLGKPHWLARYAERFDTVEVNSTFYRLASRDAVTRWVEQTPPGFLFAAKASRYLTHVRRLREPGDGVARFLEPLEPLARSGKLGPIVWQLPANFHRDDARLADVLAVLPPGRHCFEFRHESWFREEVYALLRRHGAALVIGDHPERPFGSQELTSDWTLIRFHLGREGPDGSYSLRELERWAERIWSWRREVDVLAYFNNDWKGFAVENGQALKGLLERA